MGAIWWGHIDGGTQFEVGGPSHGEARSAKTHQGIYFHFIGKFLYFLQKSRGPGQGRSQKWPKEAVLRPEIAKGGGFEGVEALRKSEGT